MSNKRIRLLLIAVTLAIGAIAFTSLAGTVLTKGNDQYVPILHLLMSGGKEIVTVDLNAGFSCSLLAMLPVSFVFLIVDLYVLRSSPVEHLGFFAIWTLAFFINVAISILLWAFYGGWGPTVVWPIVAGTLLIASLAAVVSEWRIWQHE